MLDKTLSTAMETLERIVDLKADIKTTERLVTDLDAKVSDHEKRISVLETTRELHFQKVETAFWKAQAQLSLPSKGSSD